MKEEFNDVIFFDYFVREGTTRDNVEINVIEYRGIPYPDEIDEIFLMWVKWLFKNGIIELGTIRDRGDEGDEYNVFICESNDMWEIRFEIPEEDYPENDTWTLSNTSKVVYFSK